MGTVAATPRSRRSVRFLEGFQAGGFGMRPEVWMARYVEALERNRGRAAEAAELLGISERHLRRLRDRFEAEGAERVSGRRACSSVNTGISPRLTTCFGPRTECARKPRCPFAVNGHILGWPTHKDKSSEFSATYVLTTNQNGR